MTRSTSSPTVDQVRLPGQAAAPAGPLDLTGMLVMHWAFRRDLDRFTAAVIRTPVEDRVSWRALARRWELFRHILHDHHAGEDAGIWPALRAKADAAGATVLDAMAAEHNDIDPLLASVAEGLDRMAATADPDARAALEVRVVAAREQLGRHLAHEERDALTLAQRHLTPAEWERITKVFFERAKSPREIAALVAWMLHDLPESAATRLLAGAAPVRVLWRLVLRRPFARRERRVFRQAD
ncbi:hemerythrin domain-containing protein [Dactylosporangium sucinum]|nr:hemerythrin domain-containing protein [Dactylosporangium sucinum]